MGFGLRVVSLNTIETLFRLYEQMYSFVSPVLSTLWGNPIFGAWEIPGLLSVFGVWGKGEGFEFEKI